MKRTLLLSLLLILMMCFSSNLFAQMTVEIGTGTLTNGDTGSPTPYGTWYKAFRQQFLILASELNDEGAGPGSINSLAFNVQMMNNITPMNNFRIRLKHTNQTALTSTFETGTYNQVFQAPSFMPVVGWNTHNFPTPFIWDGTSNLLVEIVTDMITGSYARNASVYYSATTFSSSLRFQSDSSNGSTGTTGTVLSNRSNMRLSMSALDILDMAAYSITGSTTPSVNSEARYTVRVRNFSPDPVSNYSVKLLLGDDEIDSSPGILLDSMDFEDFEFDWTPTQTGPATLYGKVEMPGDENPLNDITSGLDVVVMEEGLTVVQIGDGTAVNTDMGSPAPYGTYFRNFRQQYLIRADEIYNLGAAPGDITALAFDVSNVNTCGPMPNYRIKLKQTNLTSLNSTFETGNYTQVYHSPNFMPTIGWNVHAFQTPFFWDGASNLLVEIVTDIAPEVGRNASSPYHSTSFNSSLRYQSDTIQADGYATGTVSSNRNNMRLFMDIGDVGSLSGTVRANGMGLSDVLITVQGTSLNQTTRPNGTYNFPGILAGEHQVRAHKAGFENQTLPVTIVGDEESVLDFDMNISTNVLLTGRVVGSDEPTIGLVGAVVSISGLTNYQTVTNAQGQFGFMIQSGNTYSWTVSMNGYQTTHGTVDVGSTTHNMGDIIVEELALPPTSVTATLNASETAVDLVWSSQIRADDEESILTNLSASQDNYRAPIGYLAWRLTSGQENNEDSWIELTPNLITETTLSDPSWPTLPDAVYRWAVKTVYTNNVLSDPRFSNTIRLQPNDLSALEIFGNTTPAENTEVTHTVVIKNTGTSAQAAGSYTVKVMQGNTELGSATGPAIAVNQTVEVPVTWIPAATGPMVIYGHVILPNDSNPSNDMTLPLELTVMDEGLFVLQIGDGTAVNTTTGSPAPYGTWYKSFREQYLFKADEVYALGGAPGLITALAFNVQVLNNCSPMPNYRIRLKHTSQTALTTTFETGEYEQVFQATNFMPAVGWNMHAFSTPFVWNGADNILVDIVTDVLSDSYTQNASTYFTSMGFNSTLRHQSDSIPGDTATTGTASMNRVNTRFFMVVSDMGSLSGTVTEDGHPVPNMLITVEDTVFETTTNHNGVYSFPFAPVGTHTVTASKNGYTSVSHTVVIEEDEETVQNFSVVGTPEFALSEDEWDFGDVTIGGSSSKTFQITNAGGGELTISSIVHSGSGSFTLTQPNLPVTLRTDQTLNLPITFTPAVLGDVTATFTITDDQDNRYQINGRTKPAADRASNATQISRDVYELIVSGNGVHSIHIGTGTEQARIPMDFYYRSSMFQTIFSSDELNGFIGMVTGIKLYNNFTSNLPSTPAKIWLGSTTQTDLSAGWISSNDMTLVYDGNLNLPNGQNTIAINFPEHFLFLEGGNMVMLIQRPYDNDWHSSTDYFQCQTGASTRSRNAWSDSEHYNPENMTAGNTTGQYPKITFEVIPGGVGHIEGIVRGEDGSPLPGVLVNVDLRASATTDANGLFYINNLLPNDYQVALSRYGYLTQTIDITIEEDVTLEMDITMEEMPQVSIIGTVVASDTGAGIPDANLIFTGYADYNATTNASGEFIVDSNVYAYNTYDYVLTAAGYTSQTGSIEVGPQDYDMGVITMEELAFAPTQVEAELSDNASTVNISWNPPDPDAFEIVESFENVAFPPEEWTQTITNNGAPNMQGVRPTWCRFSTADGISPSDGGYQAGLVWIAEHQDEWLFSPGFTCPPDAYVRFDTHLNMGSEGGDHYYVKLSTDDGASWEVLWDGAAQPEGLNSYDTPIVIDLTEYAEQTIKLAWHADDGADAFGMWYNWFIDNIYIGNFVRTQQLSTLSMPGSAVSAKDLRQQVNTTRGINIAETNAKLALKTPTNSSRALTGYKVWRLRHGQEGAENNWVLITDETLTETGFEDTGWSTLAQGQYLWAVRAVYTSDIMSVPVFSNVLTKELTNGTISGFVRSSVGNQPIAGATVSAGGQFNGTTTANGFYNISLPAGTYTVTATHAQYTEVSHENVVVIRDENTTLNFIMEPTSNEDVVEITVTALNSNYPNPFNPETTISYDIKDPTQVRLDVFNLKGQLVKTLVNDNQASGRYNVVFTATDERGNKLSSGLYFYRLRAGDYIKTHKMMLME